MVNPLYKHKTSKYYHYQFYFNNKRYSGTTKETNHRKALDYVKKLKDTIETPTKIINFKKKVHPLTFEQAVINKLKFNGTALDEQYEDLHERLIHSTWNEKCRYLPLAKFFQIKTGRKGSKIKIADIDLTLLADYPAWRRKQPKIRGRQITNEKIKDSSINREFQWLKMIMNFACKTKKIVIEMDTYKWKELQLQEHQSEKNILTYEEEIRLFKQFDNYHNKHFKNPFKLLLLTGQRIGMVLNLQIENVDMESRKIYFYNTKAKRTHELPMNDEICDLMKESIGGRTTGYVFLYLGKPFKNATNAFKNALRNAGITKRLRLHDLRHTCGTRLSANGVPIQVIQKILDHTDIKTTQQYARTSNPEVEKALQTLTKQ